MRVAALAMLALSACATVAEPDTLAAGASWVAIGQEPGWRVDVRPGQQIEVIADYGEVRATLPYAAPSQSGGGLEFRQTGQATDFRLRITSGSCADSMSGQPYPAHAEMVLDGRTYRGCAGPDPKR